MDCCYICGLELAWMQSDTDGYCEWCRNMRKAAPSQELIRRSCHSIQQTWSPELELCHRTGSRAHVALTVPVAIRVTDHMVRREGGGE